MTTSNIKRVDFAGTVIMPDDKWSAKALQGEYDINLHEYGVLLAAGQQSRLIPWHAVAGVVLEVQKPIEIVEIVESPMPLQSSESHEEKYIDADPAAEVESPADVNPEPHSDAEAGPAGRVVKPAAKTRGKKGH